MTIDEKSLFIYVYSNNDINMYFVDIVLIYMLVFLLGLLCFCYLDLGSRFCDLLVFGVKD